MIFHLENILTHIDQVIGIYQIFVYLYFMFMYTLQLSNFCCMETLVTIIWEKVKWKVEEKRKVSGKEKGKGGGQEKDGEFYF